MFKKIANNFGFKIMSVLGVVGAWLGFAQITHAAEDADLVALKASTTEVFADNKTLIIGMMVSLFVIAIVIIIARKLLGMAKGQIAGSLGGKKKGRR